MLPSYLNYPGLFQLQLYSASTFLCDELACSCNALVSLYGVDVPSADELWRTTRVFNDNFAVLHGADDNNIRDDANDVKINALYWYDPSLMYN